MKKLYLKTYEYNIYSILNELRKKIQENGGLIVSEWRPMLEPIKIHNRTLREHIQRLDDTIKKIDDNIKTTTDSTRVKHLLDYKELNATELNELKTIKDNNIVFNTSYLNFKFDNYIYYIQFDSNPYFEHYFCKSKIDEIKDNKYVTLYNRYFDKISIDIFDEINLFDYKLTPDEIELATNILYFTLLDDNTKESEIVTNKKRKYCNCCDKYSYEYIKEVNKKEYKEVIINESELKENDI